MKTIIFVVLISVAICSAGSSWKPDSRLNPPYINRPPPPKPFDSRFRRSPEPKPEPQGGSIILQGTKPLDGPERRPSWTLDYQHNIYKGKNGEITAGGGAMKLPGQHVQPHVGVQGTWRFRRSPEPEPQGSIVFQGTKPMSGPERRPTYSLDYQHKIYEGKNGHISASGGVSKFPGQHAQPQVGIQGQWRFRRNADQELYEDVDEENEFE